MKLIIPMAGRGTRVRPHSHTVPKPLLPVAGTMIVERIIETFARTLEKDITEIVFILGPDFGKDIKKKLAEMSERHNAQPFFKIQETALGTAHAVASAEEKLHGEAIIVFADTIFDTDETVSLEGADSVIWLKEVDDPSRFGVAVHEGDKITDFVEKPGEPISNLAIIGVYYFKNVESLHKEIQYLIDNHIKGHGGEYQLTDALDRLLKQGKVFKKATVDEWLDCGTLPAWLDTTTQILEKEKHPVGTYENTTIHPPVFIGKDVTIKNSEIGPGVSIEAGTSVDSCKISESIIQAQAVLKHCSLMRSTVGNFAEIENVTGTIHAGDHTVVQQKS